MLAPTEKKIFPALLVASAARAAERLLKLCGSRNDAPRWDDIATLLRERERLMERLSAPPPDSGVRETADSTSDIRDLAAAIHNAREGYLNAFGTTEAEPFRRKLLDILYNDKGTFAPLLVELADRRDAALSTPPPTARGREAIVIFLLNRDEDGDSLEWAIKFFHGAKNSKHEGDCVLAENPASFTCSRCVTDKALRDADAILALTPSPSAASLQANVQSKLAQLKHYRDNECQLDHARTIAEGRILQLEQVAHWIAAFPSLVSDASREALELFANETSLGWAVCNAVDAYRAARNDGDERTLQDFLAEKEIRLVPAFSAGGEK